MWLGNDVLKRSFCNHLVRKRGDEESFSAHVVRRRCDEKIFCEHKDRNGGDGSQLRSR
jgi:hypothetical protein